MIPFITCDIALCQYVCELVFGINVFDVDLWVQVDCQTTNQAQLCGFGDTCLIVGLMPLMIILITASFSSKM